MAFTICLDSALIGGFQFQNKLPSGLKREALRAVIIMGFFRAWAGKLE